MKRVIFVLLIVVVMLVMFSCKQADMASYNLSQDADEFKIYRRVIFYNGITDTYMLSVEGFCSIEADTLDGQLELTVKTGEGEFKKHFLGLSDNVTYFVEQLDSANVSTNHYKVIFRPSAIIPDIDIK